MQIFYTSLHIFGIKSVNLCFLRFLTLNALLYAAMYKCNQRGFCNWCIERFTKCKWFCPFNFRGRVVVRFSALSQTEDSAPSSYLSYFQKVTFGRWYRTLSISHIIKKSLIMQLLKVSSSPFWFLHGQSHQVVFLHEIRRQTCYSCRRFINILSNAKINQNSTHYKFAIDFKFLNSLFIPNLLLYKLDRLLSGGSLHHYEIFVWLIDFRTDHFFKLWYILLKRGEIKFIFQHILSLTNHIF